MHLYIYTQNVKNFHPVFEKLEFYLNLKNDFALTFIQDKHRVYFFWKKKKPKTLTKRDSWKIFSRIRRHKSYEKERTNLVAFSFFPFIIFLFCIMYEKELFSLFFFCLISC